MRAIDLTHTIAPGMPVYPGTEPPILSPGSTYARDGFRETRLTLFSHTGTHMDAPAHLFPDRTALDALPASQFCGSALVVDCTDAPEGSRIGLERIARQRQAADRADFLLLRTAGTRAGHARLLRRVPGHHRGVRRLPARHAQKGRGPGRHRHRPHRGCEPLPAPPPPLPGGLCHHREPVQPGRLAARGSSPSSPCRSSFGGFGRRAGCARWRSCRRSFEKEA